MQSHAPLAGVTAGRLEFTKGAAKVNLRGDGSLTELYRATFEGPALIEKLFLLRPYSEGSDVETILT